uniref:S1 motif domain-containing protein n=1 Tax=Tetradesmus obliquus TaxID=3088 RepID=A0A383V9T2_TETOB|eukprot:jgi/Sobl393_1/6887/SZX61703.1
MATIQSPLEVLTPGMVREFMVISTREHAHGQSTLSLAAIETQAFWHRIKLMQAEDVPVHVTVTAVTKGGLLVQYKHLQYKHLQYKHLQYKHLQYKHLQYKHLQGFMPNSQLGSARKRESLADYVGKELPALFLEVDKDEARLVFGHRRAFKNIAMRQLEEGHVVTGVVSAIKVYGAFVDIDAGPGCIRGLLHISQISHERLISVGQPMQVGEGIKAMVFKKDMDNGRVTLSTKHLENDHEYMLRNKQLVFDGAEAMAEEWRARLTLKKQAEVVSGGNSDL